MGEKPQEVQKIDAVLKTTASSDLENETKEELELPDPDPEVAKARLTQSTKGDEDGVNT